MAGHIDRQWVNKEILNFNRGIRPYEFDDAARVDNLADAVCRHLHVRDNRDQEDVKRHLQMSLDDEGRKINTDARDIINGANLGSSTRHEVPSHKQNMDMIHAANRKAPDGDPLKVVEALIGEGEDDVADGGEHIEVSGPQEVENEAAQEADALLGAAERLSGFIDRRANANNPQLLARIAKLRMDVSDLCAEVEGVN